MRPARRARPLHFILRYSDALRGVDTYAAHKMIEERFGWVWWGKFGVGAARDIIAKAKRQIQADVLTYVFLGKNKSLMYRGRLLDILGGGRNGRYRPKELAKVPDYYRRESCAVWFKLTDLRPIPPGDRMRLALYHSPLLAPQLTGMRSLIYVTEKQNAVASLL